MKHTGMDVVDFAKAHHRRLLDWASQVFREEGPNLEPRIAAVRSGELLHFKIDKSLHLRGLVQAASVLARAVGDEEFVMALSPGKATLTAREWGAVADIRSRTGERGPVRTLRMLGCRPKAKEVARWQRELPASMVAHLGDWAEPGYAVDPWLEVQLAIAGVPGAQGGGGGFGATGGGTPLILTGR